MSKLYMFFRKCDHARLSDLSLTSDNDPDVNGPSGETSHQNPDDEGQSISSVTQTSVDNGLFDESPNENSDDGEQPDPSHVQTPDDNSSSNEMSEGNSEGEDQPHWPVTQTP